VRPVILFFSLIFSSLSQIAASETDALAISLNIQSRHLIYNTVRDPVFASPASDQIVSYSRCGDSAIWTGHYLAAEAFRYSVTHSPDAIANARRALAGIQSLMDVTGTNVLARCLIPDDSPYKGDLQSEEAHNGVYRSAPGNTWIGGTSRDQYSGVMFGLGVAFDLFDDPALKSAIAAQVTRVVDYLRGKDWLVVMPNGAITTTFLIRPDQQLAFLQLARHVNPNRFSTAYDINRVLLSPLVIAPVSIEVQDDSSYFKFNIDSIDLYTLIHLESSSFNEIYRKAYDILRNHTDDHRNAFFNMIDRALNGPNPARDAETRALLEAWLLRPRRDRWVELRGKVPACGAEDRACQPIPVEQRVTTDFIWQRSPFQMVGGGSGVIETAGIDYILPYWMARYYGVIDAASELRVVSAASGGAGLAPEAIGSLIGSGLAPAAQSVFSPVTNLGGISVRVKDSAGVSRLAALYYVSHGQINFVVPAGTAPGIAEVAVEGAGTVRIEIRSVAPALFSQRGVVAATAIRVAAGRQEVIPVFQCSESACTAVPIDVTGGPVYLSLYGTGIRNRSSLQNVTCAIGSIGVAVGYAGAQGEYPGLDQLNETLTSNLRGVGETDLVVTADGQMSNPVRISLR